MAAVTDIARPYAKAAFEFALAHQQLQEWAAALNASSEAAALPIFKALLADPRVSTQQAFTVLSDLKFNHSSEFQNFLRLLAENDRLGILPEITALFAQYLAEHEKQIEVSVSSATALTESQKISLMQALSKKLGRDISLACNVDKALIGGMIIRTGDLVIDGSVRGKLSRMAHSLSN